MIWEIKFIFCSLAEKIFLLSAQKERNFSGRESELGSVHYSKRLSPFPIHPHRPMSEKKNPAAGGGMASFVRRIINWKFVSAFGPSSKWNRLSFSAALCGGSIANLQPEKYKYRNCKPWYFIKKKEKTVLIFPLGIAFVYECWGNFLWSI